MWNVIVFAVGFEQFTTIARVPITPIVFVTTRAISTAQDRLNICPRRTKNVFQDHDLDMGALEVSENCLEID